MATTTSEKRESKKTRPRAEGLLLVVPALDFNKKKHHGRVNSEDLREQEEAAAMSAPTPGTKRSRPPCPSCGHRSHVRPWQWWPEKKAMIWHCSRMGKSRGAQDVCARMWIESHRAGYCFTCHRRTYIQEHGRSEAGPILGYWCPQCVDFSQ